MNWINAIHMGSDDVAFSFFELHLGHETIFAVFHRELIENGITIYLSQWLNNEKLRINGRLFHSFRLSTHDDTHSHSSAIATND